MNLLHLRYAVEVEKTCSLNKAAEKMFVSQPNLSRAIKELEESIGIIIFRRTYQGMYPTEQGEVFLTYARNILGQIDDLEAMYNPKEQEKKKFSISTPRASYISRALTNFINKVILTSDIEIYYKETNSLHAINNILQEDYNLGIIRYQTNYKPYFDNLLSDKGLTSKQIMQYQMNILVSKNHPLALKNDVYLDDLIPFIQIAHGDHYVPSLSSENFVSKSKSDAAHKTIYVFERGSQFDILNDVPGTYMWVSPVPEEILSRYNLISKKCCDNTKIYIDSLIYSKDYHLTKYDNIFLNALYSSRDKVID